MQGFERNSLVVAVDGGALLGGELHGGEAVNAVGNLAEVAAIRALHHKVGRNHRALPGLANGGGNAVIALNVRARDRARIFSDHERNIHLFVIDGLFEIRKRIVHVVKGIQAHIGNKRCLRRQNICPRAALTLRESNGRAQKSIELAFKCCVIN